jgi:hypothetical protein
MDDNLEHDIGRGQKAELLLNDPLLNEVLQKIERNWMQKWQASEVGDTTLRETAFLLLKNLEEFKRELRAIVDNGKMADAVVTRRRGRPPKS